ncbi:hypothetical protein L873DRAFT_661051 [Choiromyces venosus 120613-1]|uniref:C2H2-type domain-containing protein n=1 Tax=Choiromyces venosus 120613-1 TaxID=1336337 RepID=A0A3N4J6C4_9PEZI|nr:hypothetical protein L873DRAFT_661051 [Choiromyces venosus 120613-1]
MHFPAVRSLLQLTTSHTSNNVLPLPAEPRPLPLYLNDDGLYSALFPQPTQLDIGVSPGIQSTPETDSARISSAVAPFRDAVFCATSRCLGNNGLHICSCSSFTCDIPGCTRATPFQTKQALNRHYEAIHLDQLLDCPVSRCERAGQKGLERVWLQHQTSIMTLAIVF